MLYASRMKMFNVVDTSALPILLPDLLYFIAYSLHRKYCIIRQGIFWLCRWVTCYYSYCKVYRGKMERKCCNVRKVPADLGKLAKAAHLNFSIYVLRFIVLFRCESFAKNFFLFST